ncbi:MAG: hypothetical protein ACLRTR_08960 [Clostridia bacterium]
MNKDIGIRDWSTIKSTLREDLRDYIFAKNKERPNDITNNNGSLIG